jgi:hypothetical protein
MNFMIVSQLPQLEYRRNQRERNHEKTMRIPNDSI